eukprot:TRINITY_DN2145_c0_g1_i1.p1 TRINITY_DN2145_c0_g1~~TRINITY_DN2145_c0_g1_i1.p1  ORF type:complete len:523 (+),score=95.36 TRINITY_DN2145_c0_g1_i1:526-2094(+)
MQELKKILGEKEPTIEKFIKILRQRVSCGIVNVREVFSCFDQDRDGYVSQDDFYKTFDETACEWNSEFIKGLFEKLDIQGFGELSQEEFYFVLTGEEEVIIDYQKISADITLFRKQMQQKFRTIEDFKFAINISQPDTVTKTEFNQFMREYGGDLQLGQNNIIFKYLCRKQKHHQSLTMDEFSELYQAQAVIKKQKSQEMGKSQEIIKNQQEQKISGQEESVIKDKEQDKIMQIRLQQDKELSTFELRKEIVNNEEDKLMMILHKGQTLPGKDKCDLNYQLKHQLFQMENLLKELSTAADSVAKAKNKSLKEIFFAFAQSRESDLSFNEFLNLLIFLMKRPFKQELALALFKIFSDSEAKQVKFCQFELLIILGRKINILYIKFKYRFGQNVHLIKSDFIEDLQRSDIETGSGMLPIDTFKTILARNDIDLTNQDVESLKNDGIVTIDKLNNYVNYRKLIPLIFPLSNELHQQAVNKSGKIILYCYHYFKRQRKLRESKKNQQSQQKKLLKRFNSKKNKENY